LGEKKKSFREKDWGDYQKKKREGKETEVSAAPETFAMD